MINAKELATDECYLEYPGGGIKLIKVVHTSRKLDVLKVLTNVEADSIRTRFHFSLL
ncbi:MAG: hypothetical protein H7Y86_03675 [Rhizobacter sp.]|nr:hypothetical protein [Ferruginibacter sp.]